MYETEINLQQESAAHLSPDVLNLFGSLKSRILQRTVLPWSEHCTECVWPTCYSTCDLFVPRRDGKCRRFVDGMVRVELPSAVNSYLLKICFKRWGKLWTPGNIRLYRQSEAERIERRDQCIGRAVQHLPLVNIAASKKRYGFKKKASRAARPTQHMPTGFVLECFNPECQTVHLSLTMRSLDERAKMPFQTLFRLEPGFHQFRVPMEEIRALLDIERPFDIEIVPNEERETTLYFGLMDFVVDSAESVATDAQPHKSGKKVKCVVWDLDNTLWDGVLVEDSAEKLSLKEGIEQIVKTLDARGILNSIASKNNADEALQVLRKFGIDEYFLYPQISWHPKSEGIRTVAKELNIGMDTLLFIDDSQFELEEVMAACPQVQTLNALEYGTILERDECKVPVTDESRERRKMYQVEMGRQAIAKNFSDDYMAFLRHCQIQLKIQPMTAANLERVHELTQRTNQMNFSGNRYDREVLRALLTNPDMDSYVLSCEDRFGDYGVIGFSLVDRRKPRMTDLMFSCRIQSKRVEHAFLAYVIRKYIRETGTDFYADYRKTLRNAPSGQVFSDMSLEEVETRDGVSSLRFPKGRQVADDEVVEIIAPIPAMAEQA